MLHKFRKLKKKKNTAITAKCQKGGVGKKWLFLGNGRVNTFLQQQFNT
jgi:hypothetical protein